MKVNNQIEKKKMEKEKNIVMKVKENQEDKIKNNENNF